MKSDRESPYFTVVFKGDCRAITGNPFKVKSDFGEPVAIHDGDALAELESLSDEALARKGAEGWRPIETAPRDGTEFIAYRPDAGVFTAGYDDEQDVWFANHGYEDITDDLPTHWMPLPPPPKGAEE